MEKKNAAVMIAGDSPVDPPAGCFQAVVDPNREEEWSPTEAQLSGLWHQQAGLCD